MGLRNEIRTLDIRIYFKSICRRDPVSEWDAQLICRVVLFLFFFLKNWLRGLRCPFGHPCAYIWGTPRQIGRFEKL